MTHLPPGTDLYWFILIFTSVMGTFTSLLLIWLIVDMKSNHDFNRLIYYMTVFDLVYFMFSWCGMLNDSDTSSPTFITQCVLNIIQLAGGTASYIISSYISFLIVYLLRNYRVWNLKKWKNLLIAIVIIPNIVWMTISFVGLFSSPIDSEMFAFGTKLSVYFRLIPIIFNIICYIISRMKVASTSSASTPGAAKSPQETAITVLVERLKYYPILQVVTRILPTWIAIQFPNPNEDPTIDLPYFYWLNIMSNLLLLVAPVGFLVVYLVMQPNARRHLLVHLKANLGIDCVKDKDTISVKDGKRRADDKVYKNESEIIVSEVTADYNDANNDADYKYNRFEEGRGNAKSKSTSSKSTSASVLGGGNSYYRDDDMNSQWNEMDDSELVDIICDTDAYVNIIGTIGNPINELSQRGSTSSSRHSVDRKSSVDGNKNSL